MRKSILLGGVSLALLSTSALAQQAPAPAGGKVVLEEIVVTAQKREQNLQTVPVSVTALSSAQIASQRIAEFSDLTRAASSLTITQATSSPNNSIILRGIGTYAFSIGVEPSVAVIIDDMPVVQQAQAFDNLSDAQRIEVLKGPQGTLFGKNASAGVVNIVTADPSRHLTGHVDATFAGDNDQRVTAALSGPLADRVGAQLGGYFHHYSGDVRDLTTNTRLNGETSYGVHGKLRLELSPALTYTVNAGYAHTTQDGTGATIRYITPGSTPLILGNANLALLPSLTGITPGDGNYNARLDSLGATTNQTVTVSGRGVLKLGAVNLISVTSYQDWKYNFQNDVDNTDLDVLGVLTSGAAHGGVAQSGPYHSTDFSQELRLVTNASGPLKVVAGGFFSDAVTTRSFSRGPVVLLANWTGQASSRSLAAFAQADYTLPTKTTITGGFRINSEKIGVSFNNYAANATANTCAAGNPLCVGSHDDTVATWKAVVSQELASHIMAYVSAASGYKGFAYDVSSGFNPARINAALAGTGAGLNGVGPVKAEHSTSYELGLKSRFLDNRVQLNLVGFLTDYSNFQAQSSVVVNNALQLVLNNVGKLRTKGVEAELSAKANSWLRIDGSAAYTDAKIVSFTGAQAYAGQIGSVWNGSASTLVGACTTAPAASAGTPTTLCQFQNRSGATLPNSPKFKFNLGLTGEYPLADGNTKLIANANYQHQSSVNFDLLGNPLTVQHGYGVFNAALGVEFGQVRVTGFVNNLFDTHYAASLSDNFGTVGGSAVNPAHVIYQFLPRDSQRYFGVKLGYQF